MIVAPGAAFVWTPIETGTTGLFGTLEVAIYDGDTPFAALTSAGVNEIGTTGIYQASFTAAPDTQGSYVLIASLDGTLDPAQLITELLLVTSTAPSDAPVGDTYATRAELQRILKIRTASAEQETAMDRVLIVAAGEINAEIDLAADADALAGWQLALAAEVNLERAVEHWQQMESPFGIIGLGAEFGGTHTATDSWNRHANKLAPLKSSWGMA